MRFDSMRPDPNALKRVRYSVIIPARNEEKVIGACLSALTQLETPRDEFEVLLIDNGSTDRTIEIAASFSSMLHLTILQKTGVYISALRNYGVSNACGPILAFLDSDCIVPSKWLTTTSELLVRPGVAAVGAHYKIPPKSGWVAMAWYGDMELLRQGKLDWIPSGDLLMNRSVFMQVGGFDESIETNEDCELCERIRGAGYIILGDSAIAVVHLGTPQTVIGFYRKIRWHATDGLRVFLRDPSSSNIRPLLYAVYTLITLIALPIALWISIQTKMHYVLAAALLMLLLPPLLLSVQREAKGKKWRMIFPLMLLYMVFGLARGLSLLQFKNWTHRPTLN